MSSDPATDRADLADLQRGDTTALNRLIARWQRPLLGFAFRYVQNSADAHDLVAELFVKFYQQRTRLRPDTNVAAWLFTALTNLCHNHHRWQKRHPSVSLDSRESPSSAQADAPHLSLLSEAPLPGAALADDEIQHAVRTAIAALPHDLKVAVLLHHYQNLSLREIAEIAGCSERGIETRLYRARAQLRHALAAYIREVSPC